MIVKLSKSQWEQIGQRGGWSKTATTDPQPFDLTIAYQNKNGFITDFGKDLDMTNPQGEKVMTLPRYGVWKYDSSKRKPQVVFTTNDLEEGKAKLDDKPEKIASSTRKADKEAPPATLTQPTLNQRQQYMLNLLNRVTGGNVPITQQGYEQVGRSEGLLQLILAEPRAINGVLQSEDFQNALNNNQWLQGEAVRAFLRTISRG